MTSTQQHLNGIAREGVIGLAGAATSAGSAFLLVVLVTRLFDADVAGSFFTVTSAFLILLPVATLGTDVGLGRFMLRFVAQGRSHDIPAVVRSAMLPVLASTLAVTAAVLALAGPIAERVGVPDGATPLRILAVALPAAVVAEVSLAGTRAFGRMRTTVLVDKLLRSLTQTVLVALAALAAGGLVAATAGWALPYVVTAVLAGVVFRRFVRESVTSGREVERTPYRDVRREFWSFTWPRSITGLAQIAVQRADIVLIAVLRSPAEAAVYTAATRFVVLGQFGNQAIQQVVQPRFTALLAADEASALRRVFQLSTAWSMAVSWPVYVVIGSMPLAYLSLFGGRYREAGVEVVVVMMLAMMLSVLGGPADTLLLMSGHSKTSMANGLLVVVVDIGLCLLLVPRIGIVGAALAWACAIAVRWVLTVVQIRRYLHVVPWSRAMAVVVAAVLVCLMLPMVLVGWLWTQTILSAAVTGTVGLLAYAAVLASERRALSVDSLEGLVRSRTAGADG